MMEVWEIVIGLKLGPHLYLYEHYIIDRFLDIFFPL